MPDYTLYKISYKRGARKFFNYAVVSSTEENRSVSLLETWLEERGLYRNFKLGSVKPVGGGFNSEGVLMNFDENMLASDNVEKELYLPLRDPK